VRKQPSNRSIGAQQNMRLDLMKYFQSQACLFPRLALLAASSDHSKRLAPKLILVAANIAVEKSSAQRMLE
jgi:hypothetical protein